MPVISFNNQVLSSFGLGPVNLSWSLSSSGQFKTVELLTTGTGSTVSPTLSTKIVRGIAFNTLLSSAVSPASGTGQFAILSAFAGTTFRVDRAYSGQTMAVIYTDDSSTLFTVVTGATTTKQDLTANGFDTSFPQIQKEVYLGYR
jgi:hypothetical protein